MSSQHHVSADRFSYDLAAFSVQMHNEMEEFRAGREWLEIPLREKADFYSEKGPYYVKVALALRDELAKGKTLTRVWLESGRSGTMQ